MKMWQEAEKELQKDKHIEPLIKKWGHCSIRSIKKQKYFEDLVNAICSQQLSGKAAETIFSRVKKLLIKITPKNILSKSDQELRDCGLSWQKVSYIKDLAVQTLNSKLEILKLNKLSDEEIINELTKVKGIGRWTAEMFLMFSLARPDILPKDDLGINKTVASWYLWRSI
ncbi:MAG: DNA-3-methyladenine glycosylase 2 family protein [Candidatus Woesebacteria bacterium]|nr:DNA-3-methyladenine glycosylase 2 family protein [Candidatus Woesebacteria bacterium]